jgi:hypothetical protein
MDAITSDTGATPLTRVAKAPYIFKFKNEITKSAQIINITFYKYQTIIINISWVMGVK